MNTGLPKTDERSYQKLKGVHPKLHLLISEFAAHTPTQFVVTEGLRTSKRQAELVRAGASRTMHSKHLTGRAVDLAVVLNGQVRWDWPLYHKLAEELKAFARASIPPVHIIAGADWAQFPDGPHFELAKDE